MNECFGREGLNTRELDNEYAPSPTSMSQRMTSKYESGRVGLQW